MSNDWLSTESTAALLKDLKALYAKRAAIDAEVARIEAFLGPEALEQVAPKKQKQPPELRGLETGDACVWLFKQRGGIGTRMTSRQIANALASFSYKKATDQITAALHHRGKTKHDFKRDEGDQLYWVYVGTPAAKPAAPAPAASQTQPQLPAKPAAAPQAEPSPQKGAPSPNGVAGSGLR